MEGQGHTNVNIFSNLQQPFYVAFNLVSSLVAVFDHNLTFDHHFLAISSVVFLATRNIAQTFEALHKKNIPEQNIYAFISVQMDYCNSLFSCLSESAISQLQFVQSTAAKLLTETKQREQISPILAQLHRLPIPFRIQFKILLIIFTAFHSIILNNTVICATRAFRSSEQLPLNVPWPRLKTMGGGGGHVSAILAPTSRIDLPLTVKVTRVCTTLWETF